MDTTQASDTLKISRLLTFNGKPECFMVWKERFSSYLLTRSLPLKLEDVPTEKQQLAKSQMYREIIMHVDDETLQMLIAINERDGYKVWEYLESTFGKVKVTQIIGMWREFLEIKVKGEESIYSFLNRMDIMIYKLQSADETISENLKIAILMGALPDDYNSFLAPAQYQNLRYEDLKSKVLEKSLALQCQKSELKTENNEIAAKVHEKHEKQSRGKNWDNKWRTNQNPNFTRNKNGEQKKKYCENCGRNNHPTDKCFSPGGKMHKSKNTVSGFASLALKTSETNERIIFDSGCTAHILTNREFFKNLETSSTQYVNNGDMSQQNSWYWKCRNSY